MTKDTYEIIGKYQIIDDRMSLLDNSYIKMKECF